VVGDAQAPVQVGRDLAIEHGCRRHEAQGHAAPRPLRRVGLGAMQQKDVVQGDLAGL
jgi:hypothetical protein